MCKMYICKSQPGHNQGLRIKDQDFIEASTKDKDND